MIVFSHIVRYRDAQADLQKSVESAILEASKTRSFFTPTVMEKNNDAWSHCDARRCFECAYTLCVQGKFAEALTWFRLGSAGFSGGDQHHVIHANGRTAETGLHLQCNPDEPEVWYVYYQSLAATPWGNTEQRLELGNIVTPDINHRYLHDEIHDIRYNEGGWFDLIRKEREERAAIKKVWADIAAEREY